MLANYCHKLEEWGLSRVDFGTLQVIYSGFFLPKIVPEERGYCEKQSRIIVIYLNMARTYNSVTFQKVCLQNT